MKPHSMFFSRLTLRPARLAALLLALLVIMLWPPVASAAEPVPRTVIALYDDRGGGIATSYLHRMAEMPLNHLGLTLEYHAIQSPLPDLSARRDIHGMLTWFFADSRTPDPDAYLRWLDAATQGERRLVTIGPVLLPGLQLQPPSPALSSRLLTRLGLTPPGSWMEAPFNAAYDYRTPALFLQASPFAWTRPPYPVMRAVGKDLTVHLRARIPGQPENDSDLIVTGPRGGMIAGEYLFRSSERHGEEINQLHLDLFRFFRLAFHTDPLPKPDTTTLAGRRIYYSHIDGDGWNNVSRVEAYQARPTLSAEVILKEAVTPYPDLPVTLTLIAADIDPAWAGTPESRRIAKQFFAAPQVEAGSHTYSHPFHWQFFAGGDPRVEIPYLSLYSHSVWQPDEATLPPTNGTSSPPLPSGYTVPRAYARRPFDLDLEITGSKQALQPLLPPGKAIELVTWSGNCSPWEAAIRQTRLAGMRNINGGDSRFDAEYPTAASLAPIGLQVGQERQIYASSSNENTYTHLWTQHFHAHRYLQATLQASESPVRLKPLNIYYHLYAGEGEASLRALRSNLDDARGQNITPVTASHYTRIAEGFYTTTLTQLAPHQWEVGQRGELQTIRFDHHEGQSVNFHRSTGVIGQRHFQGSLYVYLDAAVPRPRITLHSAPAAEPPAHLTESRWRISALHRRPDGLDFTAQGFGAGDMRWQVPAPGHYRLQVGSMALQAQAGQDGLLTFTLPGSALTPLSVSLTRE